jgi:NADPH:quinone reductase-like Zn-dependent oxidoreductase
MTAAIFETYGPPDVIQLVQVTAPEPGPGEVLLRTRFAAVNSIDCATRAGRGVPVDRFPGVLGWDVAGTVVALGREVSELKEGDEVFGMPRFPQHVGCCADYVLSPATSVIRIPDGIGAREAAAAPMVALTACQALDPATRALSGLKILVHGASGGVGHIAVQIAKHGGAHVVATASGRNRAFLIDLGADEVHDYTQSPFEDAISDVDLALDTRGGPDLLRLIKTVKPGGMIATLKGDGDATARSAAADKNVMLRIVKVGPDRDALIQIGEHLRDGAIRLEVESEFLFADIARAHAMVEAGHVRGRVVLRIGS